MEHFRIPSHALRKQYLWTVGAFLAGGVAMPLLGAELSLMILAFAMLALVLVASVSYWFARRKVWLTLSSAGLRGRGFLGRRTNISWADPTAIAPVSPPRLWGMPGITLLKLDKDGIPLHFGSVFIPRAILQEPTFRAAVQSQGRSQFKSV